MGEEMKICSSFDREMFELGDKIESPFDEPVHVAGVARELAHQDAPNECTELNSTEAKEDEIISIRRIPVGQKLPL